MGVTWGIFNFFIVIPQLCRLPASIGFSAERAVRRAPKSTRWSSARGVILVGGRSAWWLSVPQEAREMPGTLATVGRTHAELVSGKPLWNHNERRTTRASEPFPHASAEVAPGLPTTRVVTSTSAGETGRLHTVVSGGVANTPTAWRVMSHSKTTPGDLPMGPSIRCSW